MKKRLLITCITLGLSQLLLAQNVGIGTATPTQKLHIVGGDNTTSVGSATVNYLLVAENNAGGSSVMGVRTTNGGNVFDGRMGINPGYTGMNGAGVFNFEARYNGQSTSLMTYDYVTRNMTIGLPAIPSLLNVGVGLIVPQTKLDIMGDIALKTASAALTGASPNFSVNTTIDPRSYYRVTSPIANFNIVGINNPASVANGSVDGRVISLYNATNFAMTVANQSAAAASPLESILTGTGGDLVIYAGGTITFVYNIVDGRWVVKDYNEGGSGNDWSITGNAGTNSVSNFLGTTDAVNLMIRTNNQQRMRFTSGGIAQFLGNGATSDLTSSLAAFGIGYNANGTAVSLANDQHIALKLSNEAEITGQGIAIGFSNSAAENNVGAKIGYIRTGAQGIGDLTFYTKSVATQGDYTTEKMRILANGNVGIGTAVPEDLLTVNGSAVVDFANLNAGGTANALRFGSASGEAIGSKRTAGGNQYGLDFYQGFLNRMRIWNNGRVAIGEDNFASMSPTHILWVKDPATAAVDINMFSARNSGSAGSTWEMGSVEYYTEGYDNIGFSSWVSPLSSHGASSLGSNFGSNYDGWRWGTLYANNGVINTSDTTLKSNIQTLPYGLAQIRQIDAITYTWKEDRKFKNFVVPEDEKQYHLGFNAQQLKQIIPEVVESWGWLHDKEEDYKKVRYESMGVNYAEITPVVVNAVKELDQTQQKMMERMTVNDFGVETLSSQQVYVPFAAAFKQNLVGTPVITVTPLQQNVTLYIASIDANGFMVGVNGNSSLPATFNWIAMGKMNEQQIQTNLAYSEKEHQQKLQARAAAESQMPHYSEILRTRQAAQKAAAPSPTPPTYEDLQKQHYPPAPKKLTVEKPDTE